MKKMIAPLFLLATASAFAAPAIDGQWKVHNSIAGNESDQVCTLTLKDNDLTGSCKTQDGTDAAVTGKLADKKLTWQYNSDYNGTPLTLVYTATLDDSGKIAGTVEVQPFNVSGDFTAAPMKAEDAPKN
jgi:hypothetical protein